MNSTYHRAIKALPYDVVFNRKPRFECLDFANRHFTKADIEEYVFDDNQDDFLITEDKEEQQLGAGSEMSVRKSGGISEALEPGRVLEEDENSTESEEKEDCQEEEECEEEGSEEKGSEEERSEEENHTFELTIETEDELLPEDSTDLDAINTYFAHINTPDSDGNESDNDL